MGAIAGALTAGIRLRHDLFIANVCPDIGGLAPVCAIVLMSHWIILFYGIRFPKVSALWFYVGGLPAVVFPVIGSIAELGPQDVCQSTGVTGIPDCFVLAGIGVVIIGSFVWMKFDRGVSV